MNTFIFEKGRKIIATTLIVAMMSPFFVPTAFAATSLFSDSFASSGNSVVTGWTETETGSSDAARSTSDPRAGSATPGQLRVRDGAYVEKTVSTVGYNNVQLKYYWRGDNDADGASDNLKVYWKPTSSGVGSYTLIGTHQIDNNETWSAQVTVALPAGANNTSIDIKFFGDSNDDSEEARVDDVSVE